MPSTSSLALLALAALLSAHVVVGWGTQGHEVVAGIAAARLTSAAKQAVTSILGGQTLPDVAMWADNVKRQTAYAWSSPLHYVDTADQACVYDYNADCFDTKTMVKGVCVTAAILNFTRQAQGAAPLGVAPENATLFERLTLNAIPKDEAVKFLVHFLGDVHQPLHVGFRGDLGGNSIKVTFFGTSTNLHSVWDTSIISRTIQQDYGGSQDKYQSELLRRVSPGGEWYSQATQWAQCNAGSITCTTPMAEESVEAACRSSYQCVSSGNKPCPSQKVTSGASLTNTYYQQAAPVVDLRVAQGGVRLAALLNQILG